MRSKQRIAILGLFTLLLSTMVIVPVQAGEPGSSGLLWLRFGVGGRAGGMGETGVASAIDATAMHWNPANLADAPGTQMAVQHSEYLDLFRRETLALSHETRFGTFGLILGGFYSDDIDRTTLEGSGVEAGTFRPYGAVGGIAYARTIASLSVGATVKFVHENIDVYSGSSVALDLGIAHQTTIPGLRLGASAQNIGPDVTLNEEGTTLPFLIRGGAAYRPVVESIPWLSRGMVAAEIVAPNDGSARLHAGVEVDLHESFSVRAGHRFSYDVWGTTFGAGFRRGTLAVDYAYLDNSIDVFDATHRFSLSVNYMP